MNWYVYTDNNPINRWDPTSRAWTNEDQDEYDRLINAGHKKEAKAFKKEVEDATKDWDNANGDIYKQNDARYRAVVARQGAYTNGYTDDFDYTRGQGSLIYLGAHTVVSPANHASVIIMVDSSSAYYGAGNFTANGSLWGGKVQYATLGAGEVGGNLVSGINRKKDVKLNKKMK